MRIIAGKYRRRTLFTSPGLTTRPITDRVKESLFEHLNGWLNDAKIADVFSGTGTMGFEALSRGARSVIFMEKDKGAFDLLRKNVTKLGVKESTFTWMNDVLLTSYRPKECERFMPYDVVFFDPPYKMISQLRIGSMFFKSLDRLAKPSITTDDALVLLRTAADATFELPDSWEIVAELRYQTMKIYWLQKPGRPESELTVPESNEELLADVTCNEVPELSNTGDTGDGLSDEELQTESGDN